MLRAVYKDEHGATYSCPVELHENKWMMMTSEGFQASAQEFKDDVAGLLTFVEYGERKDSQLHVERLPGESGFAAMQRAYAEQEIATQRRQRQQLRAQVQTPADAKTIEQVRQINNEWAALKRPRGRGQGFIIGGEE